MLLMANSDLQTSAEIQVRRPGLGFSSLHLSSVEWFTAGKTLCDRLFEALETLSFCSPHDSDRVPLTLLI